MRRSSSVDVRQSASVQVTRGATFADVRHRSPKSRPVAVNWLSISAANAGARWSRRPCDPGQDAARRERDEGTAFGEAKIGDVSLVNRDEAAGVLDGVDDGETTWTPNRRDDNGPVAMHRERV